MKSNVIVPSLPVKFPFLAKHKASLAVVLWETETRGVVVGNGQTNHNVGHIFYDNACCFSTEFWEVLPSGTTVTLTQE